MPGWCNGLILFVKSLGVGLDRFGADWRRLWGESWLGFRHFLPFLAIFRPKISVSEIPILKGP